MIKTALIAALLLTLTKTVWAGADGDALMRFGLLGQWGVGGRNLANRSAAGLSLPQTRLGADMRLLTYVAISVVLLALAAPASGAAQKDLDDCNQNNDLDRLIAGCSHIIDDTSMPPHSRVLAYDRRANAYRSKHDFGHALADYDQAILFEPQNANLFADRGIANSHKKDYDRAVADFSRAVQLAPSNSTFIGTLMFYRGYALHAQGKYTQAISDYDRAIHLEPKNDSILYNRAYAYLSLKQVDAALSDFEASLRLNPKSPYAIYGRGISRLRKGYTGGNEDVAAAREIRADIAENIWSGYRVK